MVRLPTIFLAVAVLLCEGCVSAHKYDVAQANLTSEQQKNAELEKQYQELNQAMSAEVGAKNMHISRLQNAIKVSINNELLFPSGGWEMTDSAKTSIAKIAKILAPHQTNHINVNGYTDTTPIGPGLAKQGITTNDILSQKRADGVMNYMISQGVNPKLVSSHGYGEADPVASNDTADGRAQNRRVELTLAN
jgi:chemotaxis protein MotB